MKNRFITLIYLIFGRKTADKLAVSWIEMNRKNKDLADKIKKNKKFYNSHEGERCFILGNGPSLRDVNLKLLENEYVFTVNNFALVEGFKDVKTNFHVWADLSFFELRKDQKYNHEELMENYYKIAEEHPVCFMLEDAYDFVKNNDLDLLLDINYFSIFESIDSSVRSHFNISRVISNYTTVVQYAITIAVYMGFSEIYLLGCDSTNIISMINSAMNKKSENMHAYKNDDVNARYKELLDYWFMTDVFYDQFYLFEGYKTLKYECDKRGIKLINCSSTTLINEIPRKSLLEVMK